MNEFVMIKVECLIPADWNYKVILTSSDHEQKIMDALESNFRKNGQIENIIVREIKGGKYEVVNGNHRLEVAKKIHMDSLMCFNLGKITLSEAKRIAIETNETKFTSDEFQLARRIEEIREDFQLDDLSETMTFEIADFERFDKMLNFDETDFKEPSGASSTQEQTDDPDPFSTVSFRLPVDVAIQLNDQINRFKKILYPEDDQKDVSYIMPIEAICQVLIQTPDEHIMGET